MKRIAAIVVCIILGCIISRNALAYTLKGIVINAVTHQPVSGVYIYVNQSTYLTITNSAGQFALDNITGIEADLIATKAGFETLTYHITTQKIPTQIRFEMTQLDTARFNVWIGSGTANGKEWFQLFQNFFMGHADYAAQCEILNSDALKFKWNDSTQILDVLADGPLMVSNEALGYMLLMNLESFKMNKNGDMVYDGTIAFKPLHSQSLDIKNKWIENRKQNYPTSQIAFWKSLYNDSLHQNGFTVQFIQRIFENESGYASAVANKKNTTGMQSLKEGNTIVKKKFVDVAATGAQNLLSNFLKKNQDNLAVLLALQHIMEVKYKKTDAWEPIDRSNGFNPFTSSLAESYSYIIFSDNPVYIANTGYSFPSSDYWVIGDWNWMGLSTAMPYDYGL